MSSRESLQERRLAQIPWLSKMYKVSFWHLYLIICCSFSVDFCGTEQKLISKLGGKKKVSWSSLEMNYSQSHMQGHNLEKRFLFEYSLTLTQSLKATDKSTEILHSINFI